MSRNFATLVSLYFLFITLILVGAPDDDEQDPALFNWWIRKKLEDQQIKRLESEENATAEEQGGSFWDKNPPEEAETPWSEFEKKLRLKAQEEKPAELTTKKQETKDSEKEAQYDAVTRLFKVDKNAWPLTKEQQEERRLAKESILFGPMRKHQPEHFESERPQAKKKIIAEQTAKLKRAYRAAIAKDENVRRSATGRRSAAGPKSGKTLAYSRLEQM